MRRKDREITDINRIKEVIGLCDVLRVNLRDGDDDYIVPVNFGAECKDDKITFYVHSAIEGRKVSILKDGMIVSFEMDCNHKLVKGLLPCEYGFLYSSVMGHAKVSLIKNASKKNHGLNVMMKHYIDKDDFTYPSIMLDKVLIINFDVIDITCKERRI